MVFAGVRAGQFWICTAGQLSSRSCVERYDAMLRSPSSPSAPSSTDRRRVDLSMTLPTMLPHGRAEVLAWCRAIDEGPWTSLAVPGAHHVHEPRVDRAARRRGRTHRAGAAVDDDRDPPRGRRRRRRQAARVGRRAVRRPADGRDRRRRSRARLPGRLGAPFRRRWQTMDDQIAVDAPHLGRRAALRGCRPGRAAAGAAGRPTALRGPMGPKAIARARPAGRWGSTARSRSTATARQFDAAFGMIRCAWNDAGRARHPISRRASGTRSGPVPRSACAATPTTT